MSLSPPWLPLWIASTQARGGTAAPGGTDRFVATRAGIPTTGVSVGPQTLYGNYRTGHLAADNITALIIGFSNILAKDVESGTTTTRTVSAQVEYPSGTIIGTLTFTAFQTGGNPLIGTIPAVADPATTYGLMPSDRCTLSATIPVGARFWIGSFQTTPAAGINQILCYASGRDVANGDCSEVSVTPIASRQGTGGVFAQSGVGAALWFPPAFIVANSSVPSLTGPGDSGEFGTGMVGPNDTGQPSDLRAGNLFTSLVMPRGFVNIGAQGAAMGTWPAAATSRKTLLPYGSSNICELGGNDLATAGNAAATIAAAQVYATGLMAGANKKFLTTIMPYVLTSSDDWSSLLGQAPGNAAIRAAYNALARAIPAGFDGCFDIASGIENTTIDGKWLIPAGQRNIVDAVMAATGTSLATLNSVTANFVSGDLGYGVAVSGAGPAGGVYRGYITQVVSSTQVLLDSNIFIAATTVAAAAARLKTPTIDGVHPVAAVYAISSSNVIAAQLG